VLAKTTTLAQRQAVEAQRELLTENVIRQFVQNKMLLIEFERSIPRALLRDSKKKAEADAKLQKNIRQAFDGALRTAREKIANAPQEEVDKLLRQDATIVRLALLMKDHRLDSDEALDTALREFGSSLDQQVKQYGEYMCGIEGARSELDRRKRTTITPQAIAECYQDHLADYHVPAKARFEILTARFARFDGDRQATREHAAKMADEVRGGKPLADVARGLSQEPRADEGGYYDWVSAGSLISQPIDQAVFSLEVGELSEPIEDSLGYHIVRVIERQKDRQILLDEARPVIEALLKEKHRTEDQQRYLQDLKSRTPVWTIYDDDDAPRTAAKP